MKRNLERTSIRGQYVERALRSTYFLSRWVDEDVWRSGLSDRYTMILLL